jgi:hypothetical protein
MFSVPQFYDLKKIVKKFQKKKIVEITLQNKDFPIFVSKNDKFC